MSSPSPVEGRQPVCPPPSSPRDGGHAQKSPTLWGVCLCPARLDDADGLSPFKEGNAVGREQTPHRAVSGHAVHTKRICSHKRARPAGPVVRTYSRPLRSRQCRLLISFTASVSLSMMQLSSRVSGPLHTPANAHLPQPSYPSRAFMQFRTIVA